MALDNVIFFPLSRLGSRLGTPGRPASQTAPFKFLSADKIDICVWEQQGANRAVSRVVIHENTGLSEEDADVALLYGPECPWARWGVARCRDGVMLWRCRDGADLGRFATMRQALLALPGAVRLVPGAELMLEA